MALDRNRVIKAAIDLLDEVGLDGLTLRRLAKELGVQAPALYWHFKNKQELLDEMVETISAETVSAEPLHAGESWDDWVADRARELRAGLNLHRDGAMLRASTHPRRNQWKSMELHLHVLTQAGLSPPDALGALIGVGNYVSGFTLDEQADRMRGEDGAPLDQATFNAMMEHLGDYPLAVAALRVVGDPQSDASFERGLQFLLDGIRARVRLGREHLVPPADDVVPHDAVDDERVTDREFLGALLGPEDGH